MKAGVPMRDLIIVYLIENLRLISSFNPESFGQKLLIWHEILGQISRWSILAWWVIINPLDLRNSIVLELIGVRFDTSLSPIVVQVLRQQIVISNPVCVTVFFRIILELFFSYLLRLTSSEIGILSKIVNYFGVVEENSYLTLYLYTLVWVGGNMEFNKLYTRIREDEAF